MTSKEYIVWLKGVSIAIKGSPTKEQWEKISKNLMEVEDGANINIITEEFKRVSKDIKFPGAPPEVFM